MRASRVGIASHNGKALLRSVAAEVPLDPDFGLVVELFHNAGAEVTLVSDGFGFYVWEVGRAVGIPVMTAEVDWHTGTLTFPYRDDECPCAECGTCKQAPIREAQSRDVGPCSLATAPVTARSHRWWTPSTPRMTWHGGATPVRSCTTHSRRYEMLHRISA